MKSISRMIMFLPIFVFYLVINGAVTSASRLVKVCICIFCFRREICYWICRNQFLRDFVKIGYLFVLNCKCLWQQCNSPQRYWISFTIETAFRNTVAKNTLIPLIGLSNFINTFSPEFDDVVLNCWLWYSWRLHERIIFR